MFKHWLACAMDECDLYSFAYNLYASYYHSCYYVSSINLCAGFICTLLSFCKHLALLIQILMCTCLLTTCYIVIKWLHGSFPCGVASVFLSVKNLQAHILFIMHHLIHFLSLMYNKIHLVVFPRFLAVTTIVKGQCDNRSH